VGSTQTVSVERATWRSAALLLACGALATMAIAFLAPLSALLFVCAVLGGTVAWVASKLRRAEADALRLEARYASLMRQASEYVAVADRDGTVRYVSAAVERVLGLTPREIENRPGIAWVHPDDADAVLQWFRGASLDGQTRSLEYRLRHADGSWRWIEGTAANLLSDPTVEGIVVNGRDVTERVEVELKLAHQALHDSVTGLPNRDYLLREMDSALGGGESRRPRAAVLFFDLDDFKLINDSHGHAEGDRVLVAVAERLRELIRPPDVLARFGGDEFAVLCPEVRHRHQPLALASAIEAAMARPFQVGTRVYHLSVSIGVSFADRDHFLPEELLRDADVAMYAAKSSGRFRMRVFDDELRWAVVRRLELEQELWRALEQGELLVHYQPEVELPARRLCGAEALVRWRHATHGLLEAAEFVPVAEETRLIVPIGDWLLAEACLEAARWERVGNGSPLRVAINLSACELVENELPRRVEKALAAAGLEPSRLCLEITERSLMEDERQAERVLGALKEIGVTLALDDFGTGYSSLTYLRRFPVDRLKIDRSFVEGLGRDRGDATIVRAVIELAERLGMEAVAEGVETAEQHETLIRLGCKRAQGLYYGRVLDREGFARLVEAPPPLRAISGRITRARRQV